ncbi:MAG: bifunctional D-glycero-beta-D-manno-heptose-7-phosphate kinase/D-glycero-beta-D-manno-heptose 1-phosphate adenylyltransferase HldE [Candidatus Korobacteraceae bacterium]
MIPELPDMVALVESGWGHVAVLVVGDVMLDQYVWGEVERISPEAPVPVLRATLREEKPGGAANVAMNLAGLGARVTLVGFGGGDREQESLESHLADAGIEPLLTAVPDAATTTKLRILSGHQQMMRLDSEAAPAFSEDDYRRLLEQAAAAMGDAAVVVLSDYAKGVLTEAVCQTLIRKARQRNIPVLVDPKNQGFARYRGAKAICPNLKELAAATGEAATDLRRLLDAGQELLSPLDVECMAVTLGEKGIAVLQRDSRFHAPAVVREVYDVSGAGDTVIAVLALAMACGVAIETAVQLANVAAGVVVSKVGTVPIQREELLGALSAEISLRMEEKVLRLDSLLSRVTRWRSAGQRIVFTNGCFDLLHVGHIRLLEEARRKGDRLIVGLNSDDSVRRLKGPLRPVVGESERAQVLAALSAVDAVVVFHDDTPLRLIEAIRPDVLVKGGDYTEDAVVGAREVRAWGGRVELIPLAGNISTTRLIARSVASLPPGLVARAFLA